MHNAWLLVLAERLLRPTDNEFFSCSPLQSLCPPSPSTSLKHTSVGHREAVGLCRSCALFPRLDQVQAVLWRCVSMPLPAEVLSSTGWPSFLLTGCTLCRLVAKHEGRVWVVPGEGPPIDQQGQPKWPLGWPEDGRGGRRRVTTEMDILDLLSVPRRQPWERNAP